MKNILNYEFFSFLNESTISFDWSNVEMFDENEETNEKLHFIHTYHASQYRYNINNINDKKNLEDFISMAFPAMLSHYYSYSKVKTSFTIQSKNFPYVLRLELAPAEVKGTSLSAVGELYDFDRIMRTEYDEHFRHLSTLPNRKGTIIKDYTTNNSIRIEPGDYIFKIITVNRREDFKPYSKDIVIDLDASLAELGVQKELELEMS